MSHVADRLKVKARALAGARNRVIRLEGELDIAKANLKQAKVELDHLLRDTCEAAENEAAGIDSLFALQD